MEPKTKTTAVGLAATLLMAGGTGIGSGARRVEIEHGVTSTSVGVTGVFIDRIIPSNRYLLPQ